MVSELRAPVAGGIELAVTVTGGGPPLLMIPGLGASRRVYAPIVPLLAERLRVVVFDPRGVGESGFTPGPSTMAQLAADAAAVLDAAGLEQAAVWGASMGGMVAQHLAIEHPARVRTLTSIMSTTGAPGVGGATPEALARLTTTAGATREERVASSIETSRIIWGDTPQFPFDEELARWRAETSVDRAYYPEGTLRQMMAIRATGDRTERLRQLDVPTLVIHGSNDPLVQPSGGEATAAAIPGAQHLVIDGMGHGLARGAFAQIVDALDRHAASAVSA